MTEVALTGRLQLAGVGEQLVGELAHRLQQPISRPSPRALHDGDERLVDQAGEHFERQRWADSRRCSAVEAADEDGERAERVLLYGIE
jgi:hypothetical protein